MKFRLLYTLILSFLFIQTTASATPFAATENLPASFQGRFRSLDSSSRLWLYDNYHAQQLKADDLQAFNTDSRSALDLAWRFHFLGHTPFNESPFFWVHLAEAKKLMNISDLKQNRFSYNQLEKEFQSPSVLITLIIHEYVTSYLDPSNRSQSEKLELTNLSKGLWVTLRGDDLIVVASPNTAPWKVLKPGSTIATDVRKKIHHSPNAYKTLANELIKIMQGLSGFANIPDASTINSAVSQALSQIKVKSSAPKEISMQLEAQFPLQSRLTKSGTTLKMLPLRSQPGEWVSLHALDLLDYTPSSDSLLPIANFTSFSDAHFAALRHDYSKLRSASLTYFVAATPDSVENLTQAAKAFANTYSQAYATIASKAYKPAINKSLSYPSENQLALETLYYRLPLIEIACAFYVIALGLLSIRKRPIALAFIGLGFAIQTAILIIRCYILARPPVSNMFETIIYVPWISVLIGLIFYLYSRTIIILSAATFTSLILLLILKIANLDSRLENVQAVLDSQYWLIIHVLMVVGSYGAFALSGILGHIYLIVRKYYPHDKIKQELIAKNILYTMYIGLALLIPGTILGGVWAAESWGRFWDWDPKESWAFISACVYLLVIHAYTFNRIADLGLAIGSIGGLVAISFTWYGVNYVLGTGLHTYGFGNGGEGYYYLYLGFEILFITLFSRVSEKISLK